MSFLTILPMVFVMIAGRRHRPNAMLKKRQEG